MTFNTEYAGRGSLRKVLDYLRSIHYNNAAVFGKAALVGELAVPCYLQSAIAGMNSRFRVCAVLSVQSKRR